MHRLESSRKPSTIGSLQVDSSRQIELGSFSTSAEQAVCALFAPLHYEPGYAYPLIVWLHGEGSDERQLMRIMPLVSLRNYVAVAPRGVPPAGVAAVCRRGFTWEQTEEAIQLAQQRVDECIALASQKYHIAGRRVFLAGFDVGGTMAFRVALTRPRQFAGAISLCGGFPRGRTPLSQLAAARKLPIFLAVGLESQEYPPTEACADLRLFHAAGLSSTLRQYPFGHELCPQMLADVDRWIIEQISSPAVSVGHQSQH